MKGKIFKREKLEKKLKKLREKKMFKKSTKKGSIRKRKVSDEEAAEPVDNENLDKLKVAKLKRELLQERFLSLFKKWIFKIFLGIFFWFLVCKNLVQKKAGVSAAALAKGKKLSKKEVIISL